MLNSLEYKALSITSNYIRPINGIDNFTIVSIDYLNIILIFMAIISVICFYRVDRPSIDKKKYDKYIKIKNRGNNVSVNIDKYMECNSYKKTLLLFGKIINTIKKGNNITLYTNSEYKLDTVVFYNIANKCNYINKVNGVNI